MEYCITFPANRFTFTICHHITFFFLTLPTIQTTISATMEASALFSTSFRPPSLHLRSRLPSKSHIPKTPNFPPLTLKPYISTKPPYVFTLQSKPLKPISASSTTAIITEPQQPSKPQIQGAKLIPLILSISIGIILRFAVPKPIEVTPQAWQLLSIFVSTIAGLVLSPLPVGAWALLGLTTTIVTKTLTFTTAFSAFTNEVIWLIVISFFFARGFVKTGLGDRIATYFVKWLGKSTLGLSYGLTLSEALIAPAMPSTTARAGGVFLPIIKSLAVSAGSMPNDPSAKKIGAYLVQSQFQCAGNSSALFLTAAAQNLLCLKLAEELGLVIASPWVSWFKAASLPAFVSLLLTPFILYKIYPPETKDTPDAPAVAAKRLLDMGPVTTNEWVMIATMILAVSLWVFGDAIGIPSVVTAMLGLSILLLLGVLEWDDCLSEKSAWDTLAWFAVLVGMAGQLTNLGIVTWMSNCVAKFLQSFSLSWPAAFGVLQGAYFLIHYMFASQTGHVGALYSAFLAMHLAAGVPGVLAALALAYNTNLFGAQTHYSSGQAAVYFGAGYVELPDVFRIGFIMACINAVVWTVVGGAWWKFLGLY
ncbi:putative solute carrier family 13 [Helianthus debilis subsp. tardiflorus]